MLKRTAVFFLSLSLWWAAVSELRAQATRPPAAPAVEHGLEDAVKWKWWVVPSEEKSWGLELPEPPPAAPLNAPATAQLPRERTDSYEVRKGDALVLIGKKFKLTVAQLKAANGLTNDMIRVGQILKLPTLEECIALGLPPEPPKPKSTPRANKAGQKTPDADGAVDQEVLLLQIFLDRENFTAGPISGKPSLDFSKLVYLYQLDHAEVGDTALLQAKALAGVGEATTKYILKREDFRFIAPPKAEKPSDNKPPESKPAKGKAASKAVPKAAPVPLPSYEEMTAATMLPYLTPWEFVAERFHCREDLLRLLNPGIKPLPAAGAVFCVPNVIPFPIEKAFAPPLQPPADPQNVITAVVVDLSRLEVYRNDRLVAVMPLSSARPGLRGKGTWKILEALPRPRLASLHEPRDIPKQPSNNFFTGEKSQPVGQTPVLTREEYLPAGPNNPVGILWINLAKADSPDPLPFGLHGTSIPSEMSSRPGIGGFRLTNWDILRAVRLFPKGTPLQWKQSVAPKSAKQSL